MLDIARDGSANQAYRAQMHFAKRSLIRLIWVGAYLILSGGVFLTAPRGERFVHAQEAAPSRPPADYNPFFHRITPAEGLPHSSAMDILQDRLGFIWIASLDGLVRYDGYTFVTFRWEHDNENSLTGNNVHTLMESSTGILWIGTTDGLNAYDPQYETFTRYVHDPDDPTGLSNNQVHDILEDPDGSIWIGTSAGLDRLDPQTGVFSHFQHDEANAGSLAHDNVRGLCIDPQGALWVATYGGGLDRLDPGANRFIHYRHNPDDPGSLGADLVEVVTCDPSGTIWVGTWGAGLARLDNPTGDFFHYPNGPDGIAAVNLKDIVLDREGMVWVATYGGGLNRLDPATGELVHYENAPNDSRSLGGNIVNTVYQDSSGLLWFGSEATGISTLDPYRKPFRQLRHDPNNPISIPSGVPIALWESSDGDWWIGTLGGGLGYGNLAEGQYKHWVNDPADPTSLASNSVFAIHQDRAGEVWIGTFNGLDRYNPETDTFTHFAHDPNDPHSLSENTVYDILEDRRGDLWVATYSGLNRLDRATGRFTRYSHDPANADSLAGNNILALYEDRSGFIWIAPSGSGLDRYDPATGAFRNYRNHPSDPESLSGNTVSDILEDRQGRLWVATWGNGLNLLDRETGVATHYHEGDGLISNKIQGLIEGVDSQGNTILWVSTSRGLSLFDPQTGEFTNYDESDGLFTSGFAIRAYHRGVSGRIYLGSTEGVVSFVPAEIDTDAFAPPLVLTSLMVDNEPAVIADGAITQAITRADHIELPPNTSSFAIEFSALDYRDPANNRYRYQLSGYDQGWIETSSGHRIAHYTNLDPGAYVFRVSGSNYDENWSGTVREVTIDIAPAWWQTRAFLATSFLLVAGAGFGIVTVRRRVAERSYRQMEQLVERRTQALETHLEMVKQLTSNLDEDSLLQEILALLDQSLDFDLVIVALKEDHIRVRFFEDKTGQYDLSNLLIPIDQFPALEAVFTAGQTYFLPDIETEPLVKARAVDLIGGNLTSSSWIAAPLKARGRVFGFLGVARLHPATPFNDEDVQTLEQFANNVAIAVDNAQLYSQVYQSSMEEERARLARDLHDSVTQILFSANLLAEVLPAQLQGDPVEAEHNLHEIRRLIHAAMAETRVMLFELRPAALATIPLGELLASLTESVTSRSDVQFQLSLDNVPVLPAEVQTEFYRIAQEALNNVVKHSQASLVQVILRARPADSSPRSAGLRTIKLSVVDNGIGFAQEEVRRGSFGLPIMRERANAIGAELGIRSSHQAGTRVDLTWRGHKEDKQ